MTKSHRNGAGPLIGSLIALLFSPLIIVAAWGQSGSASPYASVDPFIGTAGGGNTFLGASLPFGMLQWGPDTRADGWYHFGDHNIRGFSLTHVSGAGCSIYADLPILPLTSLPVRAAGGHSADWNVFTSGPNSWTAGFVHAGERAHPGEYRVVLNNGIRVELTVAARAGIARITFPNASHPVLVFKAGDSATASAPARAGDSSSLVIGPASTISGTVHSGGFCGSPTHYTLYFAAQLSRPIASAGVWDSAGNLQPGARRVSGHGAGGWVSFRQPGTLLLKLGISFVSLKQAANNLREIPGWDFARVRHRARKQWSAALARASVQGGTAAQRSQYYTALYHMLLAPTLFSDHGGTYVGFDGKTHQLRPGMQQYSDFSDWDIYRDVVQLHALLFPSVASQEAASLLRDARQSGWYPHWPVANDNTYVMGGDSEPIVVSDLYAFGARGFDAREALRFMVKSATTPGRGLHGKAERPALAQYRKLGYVPLDPHAPPQDAVLRETAASVTLEYAGADFATSRLAAALGDQAEARLLLRQSENWRNLLDPQTRFIRPRLADGSWLQGFNPDRLLPHHTNWDKDDQLGFEEGSTWQYTWMVPQDYSGLFAVMGGEKTILPRLNAFFQTVVGWGKPTFTVVNEPDFCAPYTYLWLGRPWRTQEIIDRIRREAFHLSPDGLPGNDDLGATSGVYLWSALGLYPEIPGVGGFTLGTPLFPTATLRLGKRRTLTIAREGKGIYVQRVWVNGKTWNRSWLPLAALKKRSNVLQFKLGPLPNRRWATTTAGEPPSF